MVLVHNRDVMLKYLQVYDDIMPRKTCYWTRKLELELVDFVRQREFIWKPIGNTNHHIQQKYKAYAEFAARLGRGFTARSVRDRWVNIRSTFNHNLRRVEKSRETANSVSDLYVPCWPLWKPLQFLKDPCTLKENEINFEDYTKINYNDILPDVNIKEERPTEFNMELGIRQRGQRTDRPRRRARKKDKDNCKQILNDLIKAMNPLVNNCETHQYWFFGKHVTERLYHMRKLDADCASRDILKLLNEIPDSDDFR